MQGRRKILYIFNFDLIMRKKFIIHFLWFTLPIIAIAYPADLFISHILKTSNNFAHFEYPIWNKIFEGKMDAKVVIYGSSRAWVHIDPQMISDSFGTTAYNLGVDGHNLGLQYLRHQQLLKHNPKPKVIVHAIDIFTFGKQPDLYNSEQFLPYMLHNDDLKTALLDYNGFRPVDFKIPLIRYLGRYSAIKETIGQYFRLDPNLPERIQGFQAQDKVWDGEFEKTKDKTKAFYVKLDASKIQLFESYIEDCKQKNIKLIFVQTPEYIEGQHFEKNRAEIVALLKTISQKHNIPFLSYSSDPLCYNKKYFYNAMHLNKTGTDLFNVKLVRDLRKTGIKFN